MKLIITESQARALIAKEGIIPDNWKQKASEFASKKAQQWGKDFVTSDKGKEIVKNVASSDVGQNIAKTAVGAYQQQAADQLKDKFKLSPEVLSRFSDVNFEKDLPDFAKFMNAIGAEMYNQPLEPAVVDVSGEKQMAPSIPQGSEMMHPLGRKVKIDSIFGKRKAPTPGATTDHKGVDLDAPSGSPVYAPLNGKITRSEDTTPNACGGHIRINHGRMETKFCHLRGMVVKVGDKVRKGQLIGYTGGALTDPGRGISTGPHLHYEIVNANGESVDPLKVQPNLA